jgi:hypothetical protein
MRILTYRSRRSRSGGRVAPVPEREGSERLHPLGIEELSRLSAHVHRQCVYAAWR